MGMTPYVSVLLLCQVMIFKGGKKMDTIIGAVPKATLVQTIDKYM